MGDVLGGGSSMFILLIVSLVFFGLLIKDVADNAKKYGK